MKKYFRLFLTGFGMGSADIVPGVSGGTIAFIFGVYEELIFSIKKLTGESLKLFLKLKIKEGFASIPFGFLIPLGVGLLTAVVTLSSFLEYMLHNEPTLIWSFFFGLVAASILIIKNRVVTWDTHDIVAFVLATVGAFLLVGLTPSQTPATPILFLISGAIAIVAMIMPGVSGSFLLLMMGKYEQILSAVNNRDIFIIGLVGIGAVLGLAIFSRFLSWLFEKHHDIAVATLTGFMLGSLRKIWPWKLEEINVLPEFNSSLITPLILMLIAAYAMIYLNKFQVTKEHTEDVEDKKFASKHKKAISSQKSHKI